MNNNTGMNNQAGFQEIKDKDIGLNDGIKEIKKEIQPAAEPMKLSNPCPARCPSCHKRCFGAVGHTKIATAGRGYAGAHQCQCGMMWATAAEWCDIMRAESKATRKECGEAVKNCHKCSEAIRRLGP